MNSNDAVDEILGHVRDVLPNGTVAVWPDVPGDTPTDIQWIRATVRHAVGNQATLADHGGKRRFKKAGLLMIQCFAPIGDGEYAARALADVFVVKFETVRNSPIWYRNIRMQEIGKEGSTVQVNVMAEFQYDDIQ